MEDKERIIAAAINLGAIVSLPPPARHHTIIQTMDLEMMMRMEGVLPQTEGFLTSRGRFVNRVEAFYIAHAAGQLLDSAKGKTVPRLFSEDLW